MFIAFNNRNIFYSLYCFAYVLYCALSVGMMLFIRLIKIVYLFLLHQVLSFNYEKTFAKSC